MYISKLAYSGSKCVDSLLYKTTCKQFHLDVHNFIFSHYSVKANAIIFIRMWFAAKASSIPSV